MRCAKTDSTNITELTALHCGLIIQSGPKKLNTLAHGTSIYGHWIGICIRCRRNYGCIITTILLRHHIQEFNSKGKVP